MALHLHNLTRRSIRRLFTAPLSQRERIRVFAAVERCAACARYYQQYQTMESALAGTADPYTVFSMERTGAALFAGLDAPAAQVASSKWFSHIAAPIAVSAGALALVWVLLPTVPISDRTGIPRDAMISPTTLVARGGYPKKAEADVGIRLFRVTEGGKAADDGVGLTTDDTITFTYTHVQHPGGNLALFGVQESGEIRWYYPGYDEETSVSIEGDKVDEPLRDGISLGVNHKPGRLRITAVFTEKPLTKAEIEQAVSAFRSKSKSVDDLTPIHFEKSSAPPIQHSVIVEIGEGKRRRQ